MACLVFWDKKLTHMNSLVGGGGGCKGGGDGAYGSPSATERGQIIQLLEEYYEARNDYTNNSETSLLSNRCACNWKINSQTINVCMWCVHRKYLMKAPDDTK